jgi:exopolysaccharide biosynthesis protein
MLWDQYRPIDTSRRSYLKGIGAAVSLGLATRATTGAVMAADGDRFTSDLGEIEDATLTASASNDAILVQSEVTPIAPGIELISVTRLDKRGWLEADVLAAKVDDESTGASLLSPGVTDRETISNLAESDGSVAGVNGDFFDIGNTNAPVGAEIGEGVLGKSSAPGHENTISVDKDGLARLARVALTGTVSLPDRDHPFTALNHYAIPADSIGLYTPVWGDASREDVVNSASRVREVTVRNNIVTAIATSVDAGTIPDDGYVLVGRGAGADTLSTLSKGDTVAVSYEPKTDVDAALDVAVGGGTVLLRDGNLPPNLDDGRLEPRTAVGVTADGSTLYLLAVDGRQRDSRGVSLHELGKLLRAFGASDALNLDGGGSTTLVAREPGESGVRTRNDPSDGAERPVSNGLGLDTAPGSGNLTGFNVMPDLAGENTHRVFPDLSRGFTAKAHDETYAPVNVSPERWHAVPGRLGTFDSDGRFNARKIGNGSAKARRQEADGETRLRVLDHLDRLDTDHDRIGLEPGGEGTFSVLGFDARGYAAPIVPGEVSLDYDDSLIDVEATDRGSFRVTATGENGSSSVSVSVFDRTAYLPVSVGLAVEPVSGFDDPSAWHFDRYPAVVEGSMSFAAGRTGQALRLDYDFTTTDATRAVYARRESRIDLPGEPQALGMWVKGDGKGAWLRSVVYDAAGIAHRLDFTYSVDWTGWQYVEASIPSSIEAPLQFSHLYPVEANSDQQYTGSLVFDDLTVKVTPSLDVPETPTRPDPLVVENETLGDDRWTFAVMADSQFVADDPNSLAAQLARRTLREVVAADPDFLVIAGDFVDTGYPKDFDLAKRMLREEVGDALPVYYLPGNHEIMGSNSLDNFKAEFEQTRYTFDHRSTRFFLLNSATGSFRTADFSQLVALKDRLAAAMTDDDIENVVVVAHHPTRDPLPTDNSQLGDRMEAELIEEWLTTFRERGGKGALYVAGHAGTVDVSRVEGVPYMVVSTTGKDPYGAPDKGGFREWTLFSVGSDTEKNEDDFEVVELSDWVRAEVRPLLTDATIDAPSALAVDETAIVTATGIQNAGLTFPLEYPATVHWEGSDDLLVENDDSERSEHDDRNDDDPENAYVATFDPSTGELTGIQPGKITLRVTSNKTSAETTVSIHH